MILPMVHFPASNPKTSILVLYCHGAGSNLNTVYALGTHFRMKYSIAFVGFDAMGEGESEGEIGKEEQVMKIMLSWTISNGYDLRRVVLCGFSVGAYSATLIPGVMPRVLISPFAGIIPFIEGKEGRF
jgi:alpha/beta superfamily hydrolase